jgi:hypothetical protein
MTLKFFSGRNRPPRRERSPAEVAPLEAARTAQRAVPTWVGTSRCDVPARVQRAEASLTHLPGRLAPLRAPNSTRVTIIISTIW